MRVLASITKLAAAASATLICAGCSFSSPTLQETRELQTPFAEGGRFVIEAGAGSLTLKGDPNSDTISVQAEIYQTTANDGYTLTLELQEATA